MRLLQAANFCDMHYYPFGMVTLGRSFEAGDGYRFGFNGKETDGQTSLQDYGMRIYNTALGRFISSDPLWKKYPYLSPYQFAENYPIFSIDLDGLETPIELNQFYNTNNWVGHEHTQTIDNVFEKSGGCELFDQHDNTDKIGRTVDGISPGSIPDLRASPSGVQWGEYTNDNRATYISPTVSGSEIGWINLMLGHMIEGTGPENYVFPMDGYVSNFMRNSQILDYAFMEWYRAGTPDYFSWKPAYGASEQILDVFQNMSWPPQNSVLTMPNFVGSADIYFKKVDAYTIEVLIFNVTSVTSGDYHKHYSWHGSWPESSARDPNNFTGYAQPYTNISQSFNLTFSWPDAVKRGMMDPNLLLKTLIDTPSPFSPR